MLQRKYHRLLSSFFVLFFLVSSFPAGAEDDLLIVPRDAGVFHFSVAELLANDTGVESPSVSLLSQPTRGELVDLGDETFEYSPGPDFGSLGMDIFRYQYRADSELRSAVVYLLADLRQCLWLREPVDDGSLSPLWREIDLEDLLNPILEDPIAGDWAIEVDNRTGHAAYLETGWAPFGDTAAGGNIELEIDPGGDGVPFLPTGAELRLVSGLDGLSTIIELVLLGDASDDFHLVARSRRRGLPLSPMAETQPVALSDSPHRIALTWWSASASGARDGGLILVVDGRLAGSATGIDNYGLMPETFRFGAIGPPPGVSGPSWFDDLEVWRSEPLLFPPLSADGFESGGLKAWSDTVGSAPDLAATFEARFHGDLGLEVTIPPGPAPAPIYLIDDLPQPENHYRARFNLRLDPALLALPKTESLELFHASDHDLGVLPFRIGLRQSSGGFEVLAAFALDDGSTAYLGGGWIELPKLSGIPAAPLVGKVEVALEVQWWAAPGATADGGARLWIDGALGGREALGLANGQQRIDRILLGAIAIPAGSAGALHLDDFESWR